MKRTHFLFIFSLLFLGFFLFKINNVYAAPPTSDRGCCRCRTTVSGGMLETSISYSCYDNENDSECENRNDFGINVSTDCFLQLGKACREVENCPQFVPPAPPPEKEKYKYEPVLPKLQIPIPGVPSLTEFAEVKITEPDAEGKRYVYIPWIGEYIAAIYGWAMGIVGILATVMIVWGGIIYLTAGGSPERITTAKSYITSALAGLVLAFGSYLLLYTVNPDLVKFAALKIEVIERIDFDQLLETTKVDTMEGGGKECQDSAQKTAYEKLKEDPRLSEQGWPDSWINDLELGDRISVFNGNPGPAGLHTGILIGWSGGKAKILNSSWETTIKQSTYCIKSSCPSPTPLVRVFKATEGHIPSNPENCRNEDIKKLHSKLGSEYDWEVLKAQSSSGTAGERAIKLAQVAKDININLGSCGMTIKIINCLAGVKGKRTHSEGKDLANYLNSIKCPKKKKK